MSSGILGILAKYPAPGQVKSRLAAETSAEWAARVAEAFLLDWLERLNVLGIPQLLAFSPPETQVQMTELVANAIPLTPQAAGDLGARLSHFIQEGLTAGTSQVVMIGTDSPTLPLAYLEQAFAGLERADVVLGPATDGGYYLVGCRGHWPELFTGISWSSAHVLKETVQRIRELELRLALLPPWYDVDTLADWHFLCDHITALRAAGSDPQVPRTERLLEEGRF